MIAKIKDKQIKGKHRGKNTFEFLPRGLYWFSMDHAQLLRNRSIVVDGMSYQLPKDWFQKVLNNL